MTRRRWAITGNRHVRWCAIAWTLAIGLSVASVLSLHLMPGVAVSG